MPLVSPRCDGESVTAMNELAVVRAAIYLCRSLHKHPSRRLIDNLIRTVHGRSIRGTHIDALIAQVVSESESGTVPNTTGPSYASCGTQRDTTGRTRENKNKIIETVPTLLSVATEREAKAVPAVAKQEPLFAVGTSMKEKTARAHGNPKPEHLLLDAIGPLVKPFLNLISMTQWRKENAHIARDLVACGVTPPQAARYWNLAFENDQEDKVITLRGLRWYIGMVQKEEASAPKLVRMSSADDNW